MQFKPPFIPPNNPPLRPLLSPLVQQQAKGSKQQVVSYN